MLENAGVKDVKCFRIKLKDGKIYKTAAFRVSCEPQSAALFYHSMMKPHGRVAVSCETGCFISSNFCMYYLLSG